MMRDANLPGVASVPSDLVSEWELVQRREADNLLPDDPCLGGCVSRPSRLKLKAPNVTVGPSASALRKKLLQLGQLRSLNAKANSSTDEGLS